MNLATARSSPTKCVDLLQSTNLRKVLAQVLAAQGVINLWSFRVGFI